MDCLRLHCGADIDYLCGRHLAYFLNAPLSWVDEMAALLLVLIAFMGCYVALSDGKLARIELFI